ncbi:MAG: peptidylprolyl isomerase, partial [Nanoarchaeota archaeon]
MKLTLLAIAAIALLVLGCSNKDVKMNPHVILETGKGTIEIELYPEQAPITVENFLKYTDSGF